MSAEPSLRDVHLKLDWAEEHIRRLEQEVATYKRGRTHTARIVPVSGTLRTDAGETSGRFDVVVTDVWPIPVTVPLLAGDVVHNLRASLDYLAWRLVELSGSKPRKDTSFPIKCERGRGLTIRPSVREDALQLVDEVQPYHSVDPLKHPLRVLNELDNVDKHRHLNLIVATIGEVDVVLQLPNGSTLARRHRGPYRFDGKEWLFQELKPGATLTSFAQQELTEPPPLMTPVESQVDVQILLGETGPPHDEAPLPLAQHLRDLLGHVRLEVVPRFDVLFRHYIGQ